MKIAKVRVSCGCWLALASAIGVCCLLVPSSAGAVGPAAPHLRISSSVTPGHLAPGDESIPGQESGDSIYVLRVINDGGAPTDGSTITIRDQLPNGITLAPEPYYPLSFKGFIVEREEIFPCAAEPVPTCTIARVFQPGETVLMYLPVSVATGADNPAVNIASVSGGGAPETTVTQSTPVTSEPAGFDFQELSTAITDADGSPFSQAGGHPYQFETGFELNFATHEHSNFPAANLKSTTARLPKGFVVNPGATPTKCTEAQFEASTTTECPAASAVGVAFPTLGVFGFSTPFASTPIYNLVPPPGVPAAFGFNPSGLGIFIHLIGGVDSAGDYVLTAGTKDIPVYGGAAGFKVELWGNPTDPSHDNRRGECAYGSVDLIVCDSERLDAPLLTMPSSCSDSALAVELSAVSWQDPSRVITGSSSTMDEEGNPIGVDGCNKLAFAPTISSQPTTKLADSPAGLDFNLHQPQSSSFEGLATAVLKDAEVSLPAEMTLNPSAGNGLGSCSDEQIGYQPAAGKIRFSASPQRCPDAAKLGRLEVSTPLLDHKLPGAIYLADPYDNPFGSLIAIYLAVEDERSGIVAKLAGKVTSDPQTGQLSAAFTENPELPIEDIDLHFFNGPKAALKTPLACGAYTTTSDLVPWSTPEGADAHPSDSFQTSVAAAGSGACPKSEAQAPNGPSFTAGTLAPQAGAYSPFVLRLSRQDGSQRLTGLDATLPKGLTGKLAGVPYCSEAQIAQAKSREAPNQGAVEQSSPSCPAASEVGKVTVGAGAGITPLYVQGHAYLAGPYKGAPLSLAIITPAVAGPFDLGAVVVRTALYVDPETAQIHAVADPFPSIIQGIPLDLRSIALKMGRPDFTLNPTSCEPMAITGAAAALTGQSAILRSSFQVGGCSALKFAPKISLSLKGATKRSSNPRLRAVVVYPKGSYANIASAQVTLPHSEFLDQAHIRTVCTRVQFAADACPTASIYGFAKATTPLLDKPIEGPVYLRSSSHKLPDLVAALDGQIEIDLAGRVDTGKGGGIRNTFETVPDAPVSKFVLEMKGGKKSLLVNSENICRKPQRARVAFTAQNGKSYEATPLIANSCGKKGGSRSRSHGHGRR